jgi:hypothetical protein
MLIIRRKIIIIKEDTVALLGVSKEVELVAVRT